MRKILFRAWDKSQKKMLYSNGEENVFVLTDKDWELGVGDVDWKIYGAEKENGDILMQFTGLKDKNGQEIFEGDICQRISISLGKRYASFVIEWQAIRDDEYNEIIGYGYNVGKKEYELEIIGNIYENPELLEDKK